MQGEPGPTQRQRQGEETRRQGEETQRQGEESRMQGEPGPTKRQRQREETRRQGHQWQDRNCSATGATSLWRQHIFQSTCLTTILRRRVTPVGPRWRVLLVF